MAHNASTSINMTIKMMWLLARTNTILQTQFKRMALNFDLCMRKWITDSVDDEGGGNRTRWITSVNPHSAAAASPRKRWPVGLWSIHEAYSLIVVAQFTPIEVSWTEELCQWMVHILYKTYPQKSPTPCATNKTVCTWEFKSQLMSNTVHMKSEPC